MLTKDAILAVLTRQDEVGKRAVGRALLVLLRNQTADEQQTQSTRHNNQMGFTKSDAKKGTGMATYFQRFSRLSDAQVNYWRQVTPSGRMRIGKYWKQLAIAAEEKAQGRLVA